MLSNKALRIVAVALVIYFAVFIIRFEMNSTSISETHHGKDMRKRHDPHNLFGDAEGITDKSLDDSKKRNGKHVGHASGHVARAPPTHRPVKDSKINNSEQAHVLATDNGLHHRQHHSKVDAHPTTAAPTTIRPAHHRHQQPHEASAVTTQRPSHHSQHGSHAPATQPPTTRIPKVVPRAPHHYHRRVEAQSVVVVNEPVAFAVVVSNEDFIDGALVMGLSLHNQSHLVQIGNATLVAIIPQGAVSEESIERLRLAGWSHIYQVHDLTKYAAQSHYAGTFNKLYLFNLTEYHRVATFDVDMLMMRNPDVVFSAHLEGPNWIGALGNSHKKNHSYFQTGMMLIVPTTETFGWLMHEFHSNPHQRDLNGRDGRLIRQYFQDRYVNLNSDLSAHLGIHEPLDHVIGFHYRGEFKPWFNKETPPTKPAYGDKSGKPMEQELGEAYRLWWHAYETLHREKISVKDLAHRPSDAPKEYDPNNSLWLMRHTTRSYVQLMQQVAQERRNLTYPSLVLESSEAGKSCDETCAARQSVCKGDALSFEMINSCPTLGKLFGCHKCTSDYPGSDEPSYDHVTRTCYRNPLDYKNQRPLCNATLTDHLRLCPCVTLEHAYERSVAFGDATHGGFLIASRNASGNKEAPLEPRNAHDNSGCFPSRTDFFHDDSKCRAYLLDVSRNAAWVSVMGRTPLAGRTVKLMIHYRENGVKAIVKFPQKLFPHEAQSEVAAYVSDRIMGVNRVPPTVFGYVPLKDIRHAIKNASDTNSDATHETSLTTLQDELVNYLEHEAGALTRVNPSTKERDVGVSIQLWMHDVHRVADSVFHRAVQFPIERLFSDHGKHKELHHTIREIGYLVAFDFIIGNDDRTPVKNAFSIGGCQKFCTGATPFRYEGTPSLLFVDQGRSFYFASNPEDNPLSGHKAKYICTFPKEFVSSALNLSHNRTKLGNLVRGQSNKKNANVDDEQENAVNNNSFERRARKELHKDVLAIITPGAVNSAQDRLERFLNHVEECLHKLPETTVLIT